MQWKTFWAVTENSFIWTFGNVVKLINLCAIFQRKMTVNHKKLAKQVLRCIYSERTRKWHHFQMSCYKIPCTICIEWRPRSKEVLAFEFAFALCKRTLTSNLQITSDRSIGVLLYDNNLFILGLVYQSVLYCAYCILHQMTCNSDSDSLHWRSLWFL